MILPEDFVRSERSQVLGVVSRLIYNSEGDAFMAQVLVTDVLVKSYEILTRGESYTFYMSDLTTVPDDDEVPL